MSFLPSKFSFTPSWVQLYSMNVTFCRPPEHLGETSCSGYIIPSLGTPQKSYSTCLFVFVSEMKTDPVLLQSSSLPASDQKTRWPFTVKIIKIIKIKIFVPQWAISTWGQGWDFREECSKRCGQSLSNGHLMRITTSITSIIVTIVVIMYCDEVCLGWAASELCLNFLKVLAACFLSTETNAICVFGRKVRSRKAKEGTELLCGAKLISVNVCFLFRICRALTFFCLASAILPLWYMKLKHWGYQMRPGVSFMDEQGRLEI